MKKNWVIWLVVLLVSVLAGEGVALLMRMQEMSVMGGVVAWVTRLFAAGWVFKGLYDWHDVVWVRRASLVVAGTVLAGLLYLLFATVGLPMMRILMEYSAIMVRMDASRFRILSLVFRMPVIIPATKPALEA